MANETSGKSFSCHRYCFEHFSSPEQDRCLAAIPFEILESGETHGSSTSTDLSPLVDRLGRMEQPPLFRFFLDGSRRTYKVDDIEYDRRIFPVLAGQLGVACCERVDRATFRPVTSASTVRRVLSVPSYADPNGPREGFFADLCEKINEQCSHGHHGPVIHEVIPYNDDKHDTDGLEYENIAISTIHEHMLEMEKRAVNVVAHERELLNQTRYLVKDGSLEYARSKMEGFTDFSLVRNNFRFVVGVSKSFNAELCVDEKGKTNASRLATLPEAQRTPAFKFRSERSRGEGGAVHFVAWYVRIRSMKHTVSPFDGVLKVEIVLTGDDPYDQFFETEELDLISANLIMERLPTCYGQDPRWPNHIYPVFLTEQYLKSRFMSDTVLMNRL